MIKKVLAAALVVVFLAGCAPSAAVPTLTQAQPQAAQVAQPVVATESSQSGQTSQSAVPGSLTYVDLYAKANPSVVSLRVVEKSDTSASQLEQMPNFPNMPTPDPNGMPPSQAEGSGIIYDNNGYIITNNHVVAGAQRIIVTFAGLQEADAKLVGADPYTDLAVIKVDSLPSDVTPAILGDSDTLLVGQQVAAIGNPFGQPGSLSTGIISGLGRLLDVDAASQSGGNYSVPDVIQTDAAINPGNSGGPLFNLAGEVIGVNTAIDSPVRASAGVGYAVPVNIVKIVVPQLIKNGKVEHAFLGLSGTSLTGDLAKAMGLDPNTRGVLVASVVDNGPAAKAGLQVNNKKVTIDGVEYEIGGDVITAIDGRTVRVFDDLLGYLLAHKKAGDVVTLTLLRNGKSMDVQVTLGARPTL